MNLELIKKYFEPKSILDIGAHLGEFYTLAKNTFPNASIFSIEAEYKCKEPLLNINPNSIIALLAKDNNYYNFYRTINDERNTGNSLYREITEIYSDEKLIIEKRRGVKLDDIFEKNKFDFIKLDTQGSELDIIQGGINLCKSAKGILIETSVVKYNEGAPLYPEVVSYMKNIGFEEVETLDINNYGRVSQKDVFFLKNY